MASGCASICLHQGVRALRIVEALAEKSVEKESIQQSQARAAPRSSSSATASQRSPDIASRHGLTSHQRPPRRRAWGQSAMKRRYCSTRQTCSRCVMSINSSPLRIDSSAALFSNVATRALGWGVDHARIGAALAGRQGRVPAYPRCRCTLGCRTDVAGRSARFHRGELRRFDARSRCIEQFFRSNVTRPSRHGQSFIFVIRRFKARGIFDAARLSNPSIFAPTGPPIRSRPHYRSHLPDRCRDEHQSGTALPCLPAQRVPVRTAGPSPRDRRRVPDEFMPSCSDCADNPRRDGRARSLPDTRHGTARAVGESVPPVRRNR